ncbi:copper chaperone PCu(A)C [Paucimonas lemoignei]|nr:copper chaperone PCu(A)C [Paucimonas lemoignei]
MQLRFLFAALLVIGTPLQARDYQAGKLHLEQPVARPTRPGQPGAATYVTIENRGNTADRLVSASTPMAGKTEIHTMTMDGGVMRMREAGEILIAPGTSIVMQPGDGYHIMLMNLKQPLKTGEEFPLTLNFEKAGKVKVSVEVTDKIGNMQQQGHPAAPRPPGH